MNGIALAREALSRRRIGRQVQGAHVGELPQPVARLTGEQVVVDVPPLPICVVDEIDRPGGRGNRLTSQFGRIQVLKLVQQDAPRPVVADDVVHHQHEGMIILVALDQDESMKGRRCQVEGLRGDACGLSIEFVVPLGLGNGRQRKVDQVGRLHCADEGYGLGVAELVGRAKRLVPRDQLIERPVQRGLVERPAQAQRVAHVVGGALRVHLVQHPHASLRKR
jgi:hypothetical protein